MNVLSKFAENLTNLMFEHDMNMTELGEKLNLSQTSISNYVRGKFLPDLNNLIALADLFNCTTDFLLGLEEENASRVFYLCPPFAEQIEKLKNHFGCKDGYIIKEAELSEARYYDWKSGKFNPSVESLIKIANLFGCSVDFVLGRTKH